MVFYEGLCGNIFLKLEDAFHIRGRRGEFFPIVEPTKGKCREVVLYEDSARNLTVVPTDPKEWENLQGYPLGITLSGFPNTYAELYGGSVTKVKVTKNYLVPPAYFPPKLSTNPLHNRVGFPKAKT